MEAVARRDTQTITQTVQSLTSPSSPTSFPNPFALPDHHVVLVVSDAEAEKVTLFTAKWFKEMTREKPSCHDAACVEPPFAFEIDVEYKDDRMVTDINSEAKKLGLIIDSNTIDVASSGWKDVVDGILHVIIKAVRHHRFSDSTIFRKATTVIINLIEAERTEGESIYDTFPFRLLYYYIDRENPFLYLVPEKDVAISLASMVVRKYFKENPQALLSGFDEIVVLKIFGPTNVVLLKHEGNPISVPFLLEWKDVMKFKTLCEKTRPIKFTDLGEFKPSKLLRLLL